MVVTLGLAFVAGVLSTLSPCVLPILPLVFGAAVGAHRFGVLALSAGLVLAFVAVGLFVATAGFAMGLDGGVFRFVSAALLGAAGILLLSGRLQDRLAVATGPVTEGASRFFGRMPGGGLSGQFLLGVALGTMWSPCVGPTLGAASLLAAQGKALGAVALTMGVFGLGAALPLAGVGLLSREAMRRWRGRIASGAASGKRLLGGAALAISVLILTGADRAVETALVQASPDWVTDLTTRY